jgi:hypothetical protein
MQNGLVRGDTVMARVSCDQCSPVMVNGVFCHEIPCPNRSARWDADSETWVKQRKCFDCGCTVDADDPCCSAPFEDDEPWDDSDDDSQDDDRRRDPATLQLSHD